MKKRAFIITSAAVLSIGLLSGFTYVNGKSIEGSNLGKPNSVAFTPKQKTDSYNDMVEIMKENGLDNAAKFMEEKDYKAMDDYMNNITDKDYDKMIDVMENNGYQEMAKAMESIGKDGMIRMHNAMGGARGMHGSN